MRRSTKALLLTIALFLLTSGTLGFASAAVEATPAPTIQGPRPGDRATYTTEEFYIGPHMDGWAAPSWITFEWLEPEWIMDDDFRLRYVHPISMEVKMFEGSPYERTHHRMAYYDAADGEPIADSAFGGLLVTRTDGGVLGTGVMSQTSDNEFRSLYYDDDAGFCAQRVGLHDGKPLGKDLPMTGRCDYVLNDSELVYEFVGTELRDQKKTYHYQDAEHPYFEAYYTEGNPFPVEYTASLSELIYRDFVEGRMYRMTLVSYDRGDAAYPFLEVPRVDGPGPAATEARDPLGYAHVGSDALVEFDRAWQAALADDQEPRLSTYLESHPDAYLSTAWYSEQNEDDGSRHVYWNLAVSDGASALGKTVAYHPLGYPIISIPGGQLVATISTWDETPPYPAPNRVPDHVPVFQDLVDRYRHFVDATGPIDLFGFDWSCWNDDCGVLEPIFAAGTMDDSYDGGVQSLKAEYSILQEIGADPDGRAVVSYRFEETYAAPFPIMGAAGQDPQAHRQNVGGVWAVPSAPAAAGLGFLALIGGALYYFWPSLKGLSVVGGFSRIQGPALLQHPGRAKIMEAIKGLPGIHFQALCRELGMAKGTARHHLDKLEGGGLVRSRTVSNRLCFFETGVGRREADHAAVLQSPGTKLVYEVLQEQPGIPTKDLALHLGLAQSTVSYHRKKLREAGLAA